MSNRFYNFVNQLISGSVAKASEVNAELQGAEVGFSAVESELNTAIKLPASESLTDQRITENAATRAGKLLGFDAAGDLSVTNAFEADWSMGGFRLRNVVDATEADEPATFGQLSTYAAGLAGLPAITSQVGCLVTDGSTVTWGGLGRNVPATTAAYGGEFLCSINQEARWIPIRANAVRDPNGTLGTGWWSTSFNRLDDYRGQGWTNNSPLAVASFEHEPVVAGRIPCGAGATIAVSANIATSGVSGGAMYLSVKFYDAGGAYLSSSSAATLAVAAGRQYSVSSILTPAGTAYVAPVVTLTAVTASAYGIIVKNLKVESANYASPFNDMRTVSLMYGASAQTYWGTGYATPIVTIGDATATTAQLDLRSTTGAQAYDVRIQSSGGTNGSAGKGLLTVTAQRVAVSGPVGAVAEYDNGNSGASKTVDFAANGQYQKITLSAATPAITISTTSLVVGKYLLRVIQDGTGGRAPTWVGFTNANCLGNVAPTIASGANAVTFVNLYWDGSAFWVSSNPWD
jgi:hypothetical protein